MMAKKKKQQRPPKEVIVERDKPVWPWLAAVGIAALVLVVFIATLLGQSASDTAASSARSSSAVRSTSQSTASTTTPPTTPTTTTATATATSSSTVPSTQAPTTTVAPTPVPTTTQAPPPPARANTASYTYCNYNDKGGIAVMVSPTELRTYVMAVGVPAPSEGFAHSNLTLEYDPASPGVVTGFTARPQDVAWTCDQYAYGGEWVLTS